MHRLWDSDLIEWNTSSEKVWLDELAELDTPEARAITSRGTVEEWATESLTAARGAYVVPTTGQRIKRGEKLAKAYFDANLPIVRRRLYQGGIRLAMVLNQAFPEN